MSTHSSTQEEVGHPQAHSGGCKGEEILRQEGVSNRPEDDDLTEECGSVPANEDELTAAREDLGDSCVAPRIVVRDAECAE
jgi:hypothetical protein